MKDSRALIFRKNFKLPNENRLLCFTIKLKEDFEMTTKTTKLRKKEPRFKLIGAGLFGTAVLSAFVLDKTNNDKAIAGCIMTGFLSLIGGAYFLGVGNGIDIEKSNSITKVDETMETEEE